VLTPRGRNRQRGKKQIPINQAAKRENNHEHHHHQRRHTNLLQGQQLNTDLLPFLKVKKLVPSQTAA
jgi:hypothetical protein